MAEPTHPSLPCLVCKQPLAGDPDDEPLPPAGPLCGECRRAREFDQTLWEANGLGD